MSGKLVKLAAIGFLAAACADGTVESATGVDSPAFAKAAGEEGNPYLEARMAEWNARFAAQGMGIAVARAEISLGENADAAKKTVVYAHDRQLRLESRWVSADARRVADGNNLTQATFTGLGLNNADGAGNAIPAIDASFATWDAVECGKVDLVKRVLPAGINPSAILGLGGFVNDPFAADISTLGFLPGGLFDLVLGPGASTSVLGVTFTLVFMDAAGNPTDIDGDHRDDTALKEVWYNNAFQWSLTGNGPGYDIETVALHENGHALELGHFGKVTLNTKTGKLQVSPRAVMNAFIPGTLRSPLGTDNAGFCGNFANWP